MQDSHNTTPPVQKFDILLFDQFSNHCLANTIEPLRAANSLARQTCYRWRFLTLDGTPVESSSGMKVSPHGALDNRRGTYLLVMPSYGFRGLESWVVSKHLRAAKSRYTGLGGLDTGSWLLARAGLLEGYRATIHWDELTSFAEAFPNVNVQRERFIIDGDRITCSGAMAAFDLVLHLIGETQGAILAMEVAHMFMTRDSARSHAPEIAGQSKTVNRAIAIMQAQLENPHTIAQIAQRVGVSQKTLEIRMRAEMKATPQRVYRRLRLNLAHKLVLEADFTISEIAGRCGYENASAMTRAFKSEFAQPPRKLRLAKH